MRSTAETTSNALVTLAVGPGIYTHELAHCLACRLLGVGIERPPSIGLFDDATLEHEPVGTFWVDAAVAVAPLLVYSALVLPLRAVSASVVFAGPVALGWTVLLYRLTI